MARSILRVKTSCSARTTKCANTTGSKFNQLSWVVGKQLPFDETQTRETLISVSVSFSSNTPKSSYTQVMIPYLLWRPLSFVTQLCPTPTQSSSCDQRSQRGCHQRRAREREREGYKEGFLHRTSHFLLLQSEMHVMFGFKCIFNGTASSHLSEFCRKVIAKEEEREREKKNILSGDWELGQARNYMPF